MENANRGAIRALGKTWPYFPPVSVLGSKGNQGLQNSFGKPTPHTKEVRGAGGASCTDAAGFP